MTLHKNRVDAALAMIAEKQLNPTDVERICGVNRTQIYRWKAGEVKQMRYESFTKLAKALNYDVDYKGEQISITPHTIKQNTGDITMQQQTMLIELQAEKIKRLEKKLENINAIQLVKPAYHFKMVSKYEHAIDKWHAALITGDVSMTGYTRDELHTLCNDIETFWIDRYHSDSLIRLEAVRLSAIRTDYHYLKWDHMMWKSKNGKYECYNIDQVYSRADKEVTAMFYWVNGNKD